jgi:pimeloyl-ACP methyl ester carboxylesterase
MVNGTMGTFERRTMVVDDCEISYLRGGSGPPVLFLHGASGVYEMPWMDALARRYDVIVPDHPGFGRSATPSWFEDVHDLAYFYLDFLRTLDLTGVHVVGNSIGGWIASEIAVRCMSRLRSLVLVSPAGLRVENAPPFDIFSISPEELTGHLFHDPDVVEHVLAARADAETRLKNRRGAARIMQPRMDDPQLAKWLRRIDVPTLVIWGDDDRIIPPRYAEEFRRLIPGCVVDIVDRCGHLPHVERPDAFAAIVDRFLAAREPQLTA